MDAPIKASYRWTVDELSTANRLHLRHLPRSKKTSREMWLLAPIAIPAGIYSLLTPGSRWLSVLFIIVGASYAAFTALCRRMTHKHFATRPDRDMMVDWEFYPDRLVAKTEASVTKSEWPAIPRVLRTPQGFLLYKGEHLYYWVPTHAFNSTTEIDAFTLLAKSKTQKFEESAA
jgi:hypothetical protein